MKKTILASLGCLLLSSFTLSRADDTNNDAREPLFGRFESLTAFKQAVEGASKKSVDRDTIILASIVYGVRNADTTFLAEKISEVEKEGMSWKPIVPAAALVGKGYIASCRGDFDMAEKDFKDAFWAEPDLAEVIAQASEYTRTMEPMANVKIDLARKFIDSQGRSVGLGEIMGSKNVLLLDFWASWCGPCMDSMEELKRRSSNLPKQGMAVAAINTEGDTAKAEKVRIDKGMEMPWLVDYKVSSLEEQLKVDSIPRTVIVDRSGRVLYNGHPNDGILKVVLTSKGIEL